MRRFVAILRLYLDFSLLVCNYYLSPFYLFTLWFGKTEKRKQKMLIAFLFSCRATETDWPKNRQKFNWIIDETLQLFFLFSRRLFAIISRHVIIYKVESMHAYQNAARQANSWKSFRLLNSMNFNEPKNKINSSPTND